MQLLIKNQKKMYLTKRKINLKTLFYLLLIGFVFTSCSSDDDAVANNQAPNDFLLEQVADGVDLQPQLTWQSAIDPDGDAVTYQVYLDTQNPPLTSITNNLGVNAYGVQEELIPETTYYWMVVAKDSSGNTTNSNIGSFTTRDFTTEELLQNIWFMYSVNGEVETECNQLTNVEFTSGMLYEEAVYDLVDNGNCEVSYYMLGTYNFTDNSNLSIDFGEYVEVWEILSITQTELMVVVNNDNTLVLKR